MAITFGGEALAEGTYIGAQSVTLTVPGTATGLLVAIAHINGYPSSMTFGGQAMTLAASLGTGQIWELLDPDFSARSDDDLEWDTPAPYDASIQAIWLQGGQPVRLDQGTHGGGGGDHVVSLDSGTEALPFVFICGIEAGTFGGTGAIDPYRGTAVEMDGAAWNNFPYGSWMAPIYEDGCPTGAADYGVVITSPNVGGAAAAMYGAGLTYVELDEPVPEEAGIPDGFFVYAGDPIIAFGVFPREEAGIPPGFVVTPTGPAQVQLQVPGRERPQLTEDGAEGQVLTYHALRKPTWEAAGSASGSMGPLLLSSDHAVPITFDDILQASDGSDLLYASEP